MLLLLQTAPGFEHLCAELSGQKVDSAFMEAEAALLLSPRRIKFRFVKPINKSGCDYDLEFIHPNGEVICAEVKGKINATFFSEKSVINDLKEARKQLNRQMPGFIFFRVQEGWISDNAKLLKFKAMCETFFHNTERVVCVSIFSSDLNETEDGLYPCRQGAEFVNEKHNFMDKSSDWRLLTKEGGRMDINMASPFTVAFDL